MAHKSYSPKDVKVSWNGVPITGFAEDSFLRLEWNEDIVTEHVGADGTLALTRSANYTGTVEIELMATAPDNLLLGAVEKAQRLEGIEPTFGNIAFRDKSNNVFAVARNAYMKTRPSMDLGSDQNSKVWTFGCENLDFIELSADITEFTDKFNGYLEKLGL